MDKKEREDTYMIYKLKLPQNTGANNAIVTIGIVPMASEALCVFTDINDWKRYTQRIHELPLTNAKARAFKRLTLGMATELEVIDNHIMLSEELFEYVTRDKEGSIVVYDYMEYYEKIGVDPPTHAYKPFIVVVE